MAAFVGVARSVMARRAQSATMVTGISRGP